MRTAARCLAAGTALAISLPGATATATATAPVTAPASADGTAAEPVRVRTLAPPLDQGPAGSPATRRTSVRPFSLIAATWRGDADRDLVVRTRSLRSGWSPWRDVHPLHEDGPDPGSSEARGADAQGSDLVWVGESDGFQVRTPGGPPRDLEVVLIDPGTRPADHDGVRDAGLTTQATEGTVEATSASVTARQAAARGSVPRPRIRFRKGWGANEALRTGKPTYNTAMKQGHVHHTVGSNDYRRADVPAIIRGIYAYHTRSLGWSDIGYNFVVDRFGEIWVGRAGGPRRNVQGAHTRGFNHQSFGVAALGSFDDQGPSSALVRGIARLSAWKLDRAGRRPAGTVWTTSHGSDKYPSGRRLQLPVLDGHRDTGATACPGELLYDRLGVVRVRAQTRVDSFR